MNLSAKFVFLIGLLGLLCLMLPGSLRADTIYTYTGNDYTSCTGTYCAGGPYALSGTLDVKAGTPLDNLTLFSPGSNITADVSTFSFTDGTGQTITQANAKGYQIYVGTDASGAITSWIIVSLSSGPGALPVAITISDGRTGFDLTLGAVGQANDPPGISGGGNALLDPGSWAEGASGNGAVGGGGGVGVGGVGGGVGGGGGGVGDGGAGVGVVGGGVGGVGGSVGGGGGGVDGGGSTTVTPEPSSYLLLGTGLLGILALAARSKRRHAPPTSC